jgi:glycosyltransferase involved in cell wall biosynthesis
VTPPDGGGAPVELSVVLPAYEEAPSIAAALCRLDEELRRQPRTYELIVVSDGSRDGTADVARSLGLPTVHVIDYPENRGKGYALRTGAERARGRLVAFMDADLDIHPKGLTTLVEQLESTRVDAVVASKVHPDSVVTYPRFRRLQSRVFRVLVRTLFRLDVADSQTGLKVFRSEVLATCLPRVTVEGWAFDLDLLVLASDAGYRVVEGPVTLDYQFSTTTGAAAVVATLREVWGIYRAGRGRHPGHLAPPAAGAPGTIPLEHE